MAWYYGVFSCGHEGRVNIIGPHKNREFKRENEFRKMCPECYENYIQEIKERKNKEAAKKSKEMELPSLEGTEKQVIWANTLRQEFIEKSEKLNKDELKRYQMWGGELEGLKESEIKDIVDYILINRDNAKYWIDNRDKIIRTIVQERKNSIKTEEEIITEKLEEEVKLESTIFPENKITNVAVEINYSNEKITPKFEKNYDFINLVKELGYKWDGKEWSREIYYKTGDIKDRVAELGNKLLNKGFPVIILDEKVREKAINGVYEQECTRWISKRLKGDNKDKLSINWNGINDNLYNVARKLPGSKWDKGVIVRVEYYKEVEEFARLYNFKFSPGAMDIIKKYKEKTNNVEKVIPLEVEELENKDGLKEILNSNSDILDDLIDD
ncbi:hypothetical protein [Clostridium rectalis]|uniref:hypothetical protein n=1 Tax=Clostridium rectalis TaxID=2040295 RepID=UPI000F631D71|nr:hypothetical protein [Clostridium rectalis]